MDLNTEQQKAIDTVFGPILILAGAGSGKTRVLTSKVAHLLQNKYAEPEEILAVTFTNKAASEMRSRITKMLNSTLKMPWVGTFHAVSLKILKRHAELVGFDTSFTIYDTSDQLSAVKEALKKLNLPTKQYNPRSILNLISSAKNELISPREYKQYASGQFQEVVAEIYPIYQKILKENSGMDFDDLLMQTVLLFQNNPEILEKYQNLFKFILIDEYQDTNHTQYILTNLLAKKHRNICVVGDDAQSIYSFRGATIKNILDFEKDYSDGKVIKLEQNYRSTKTILDASNEIIRKNKHQKAKTLWTENQSGEKIELFQGYNETEEAEWISEKINKLILSGTNPGDIAILYRTNAQSRSLEESMLRNGINYKIVGNVKFYERKEVKDIMAYLRILYNPKDNINLKRIINVPRRGLGPKAVRELEFHAARSMQSIPDYLVNLENKEELSTGLKKFVSAYESLKATSNNEPVSKLIDEVLDKTGYFEMLNDGTLENEVRLDNTKELKTLAQRFDELPPQEGLQKFLEEVSLIEDYYKEQENSNPKITLMTIHAAKGLEYDHIFVSGLEEGIFPHSRSFLEPKEMEEERRLAYVAYTRAKKNLYLTHTESRTFYGAQTNNPLSRFVSDIPEHLLSLAEETISNQTNTSFNPPAPSYSHKHISERASFNDLSSPRSELRVTNFEKGDHVKHGHFGDGYVIDISDDTVLVEFSAGTKELAFEFCNLVKC